MNAVLNMVNGFTLNDLREQRQFLLAAHGSTLVKGVGRGRFLQRLLSKPNVDYVTVVEPNLHQIWRYEKEFREYAHKLTFVNCRMGDIVNKHVYDLVYHP